MEACRHDREETHEEKWKIQMMMNWKQENNRKRRSKRRKGKVVGRIYKQKMEQV